MSSQSTLFELVQSRSAPIYQSGYLSQQECIKYLSRLSFKAKIKHIAQVRDFFPSMIELSLLTLHSIVALPPSMLSSPSLPDDSIPQSVYNSNEISPNIAHHQLSTLDSPFELFTSTPESITSTSTQSSWWNISSWLYSDPVDDMNFPLLLESVKSTCRYIIDTYYPHVDDVCELYIIIAQAYCRFGSWYEHNTIFKYTDWATRCSPNQKQLKSIAIIENIAYNYKIKAYIEQTVLHVGKSFVMWQGFLLVFGGFFPQLRFIPANYNDYFQKVFWSNLGATTERDADGNVIAVHRDLDKYLLSKEMPYELLTLTERLHRDQAKTELAKIPSRIAPPPSRELYPFTTKAHDAVQEVDAGSPSTENYNKDTILPQNNAKPH